MFTRQLYLDRLKKYQDTEFIKIITGVRRSGKTFILQMFRDYLQAHGIKETQIIFINFEAMKYQHLLTKNALYQFVVEHVVAGQKMYLFFDEVQRVKEWQDAINSFRVDLDADIYVSGSNASLLSGELSTLLTGRMVEIQVYPLSFKEFIEFKQYQGAPEEVFVEYVAEGGFPAANNHSVAKYIALLRAAFIFYRARRYDLRGKNYLRSTAKYYAVDTGLRNTTLNKSYQDNFGHQIENIVFIELLRRGYRVDIGKYDDREVDFIARRGNKTEYYQVMMQLPVNNNREIGNLKYINDNYKKTVITANQMDVGNVGGIEIKHIVDWLLN